MSKRFKIKISIALALSLAWIIGFIWAEGASLRSGSDLVVDDAYETCVYQKKDMEACEAERDANRDEAYNGIPWGSIVFFAVAPVIVIWAVGLIVWYFRRRSRPSIS